MTHREALALLRSRDREIRELRKVNAFLMEITLSAPGVSVVSAAMALYTNKRHGLAHEAGNMDCEGAYWIIRETWRDVKRFRSACAWLVKARDAKARKGARRG